MEANVTIWFSFFWEYSGQTILEIGSDRILTNLKRLPKRLAKHGLAREIKMNTHQLLFRKYNCSDSRNKYLKECGNDLCISI